MVATNWNTQVGALRFCLIGRKPSGGYGVEVEEVVERPDGLVVKTLILNSLKSQLQRNIFFLGGEFIFDKMNFLEKIIVKKASKITSNKSNILEDNIRKFAQTMNAI